MPLYPLSMAERVALVSVVGIGWAYTGVFRLRAAKAAAQSKEMLPVSTSFGDGGTFPMRNGAGGAHATATSIFKTSDGGSFPRRLRGLAHL